MLRKAGRAQGGGSQATLRKKISEFNIDISHFTGQHWRGAYPTFEEKYTQETLFVKGKEVTNLTLRRYISKYHLIPYKCVCCGCDGTWMGQEITLQLHHKDGDRKNNELSNLEFRCPNCHSITETYAGKNISFQRTRG